jgi:hypothetical protein
MKLRATLLSLGALIWGTACTTNDPAPPPGSLEAVWTLDAPGRTHGLLVREDGNLVVAVSPGAAPFEATGGALILDPEGEILAEIPLAVPPPCDGCSTQMFHPNAPLALPGGRVVLGDFTHNHFLLNARNEATYLPWSDPDWMAGPLVGVDGSSCAPAPGGDAVLLPGTAVVVFGLDGVVRQAIDLQHFVHGIVHLGGAEYLLVLSEFFGEPTILSRWNAETGTRQDRELEAPIAALASGGGWTVAILDLGSGDYLLMEVDGGEATMRLELPAGNVRMALHPELRLVAAGSQGVRWGDEKRPPELAVGGAVIADMETGEWLELETSSVHGLAFDEEGTRLFVSDTGGVRAFSLE